MEHRQPTALAGRASRPGRGRRRQVADELAGAVAAGRRARRAATRRCRPSPRRTRAGTASAVSRIRCSSGGASRRAARPALGLLGTASGAPAAEAERGGAGHQAPSTSARKCSPRASKFAYWSKLAQAGESSTTSPGRAAARGGGDRALEVAGVDAAERRSPPSARGDRRGVLADQVDGGAALGDELAAAARSPAACAAAEDQVDAARDRSAAPTSALSTLVAFESLT